MKLTEEELENSHVEFALELLAGWFREIGTPRDWNGSNAIDDLQELFYGLYKSRCPYPTIRAIGKQKLKAIERLEDIYEKKGQEYLY